MSADTAPGQCRYVVRSLGPGEWIETVEEIATEERLHERVRALQAAGKRVRVERGPPADPRA